MAFLTGYVMPKAYYEKVGADGFEAAPVGSGPYKVDRFERNAFLKLSAHEGYWGGAPAFKSVIIKFVPDASSRVAEIDSGKSQVVFDITYEEFDRLKDEGSGLKGVTTPVSDIAHDLPQRYRAVMTDPNVRHGGGAYSIDKQLLVDRLLRWLRRARSTRLQAPEYVSL